MTSATGASFDADAAKSSLNQYWYSKKSIAALIGEVLHHATACAFLSTPSLFFALDERRGDESEDEEKRLRALRERSRVFEFDEQWSSDPAFVFYDFQHPDQVPVQHMGEFDFVVADPPFITADVWEAYMCTVKLLLKPGGKVLFTTVLENHTMLETLLDGPLFIPLFRPLVRHLTYQYVCYTNYEATVLNRLINDEIEAEDPKVRAAIEMANNIRQSEEAFALQMKQRQRDGEAYLPTHAYEREKREEEERLKLGHRKACAAIGEDSSQNVYEVKDWNAVPLQEMPWGHIPEGLAMYASQDGATEAEAGGASSSSHVIETPAYTLAFSLRQQLDGFKGQVDVLQKLLNQQLLLKNKLLKRRREIREREAAGGDGASADETAELEALEKDAAALTAQREEKIQWMSQLTDEAEESEKLLAKLLREEHQQQQRQQGEEKEDGVDAQGSDDVVANLAYLQNMRECVDRYRNAVIQKAPLLELASAATGRFKAPVFGRMKALLQEMKDMKKRASSAATGNNTA